MLRAMEMSAPGRMVRVGFFGSGVEVGVGVMEERKRGQSCIALLRHLMRIGR